MANKRRRNSEQEECTTSDYDNTNNKDETKYIICDTTPCAQYKIFIELYNDHVEKMHTYTCECCHRNLPSDYALNIHIDESHNPFAKKPLRYKCWDEECDFLGDSQKQREDHMRDVHGNAFISFSHH